MKSTSLYPKMSGKCFVISSCVCLLLLTAVLFRVMFWISETIIAYPDLPSLILTYPKNGDEPSSVELSLESSYIYTPSLESFIEASAAENSLSGLAVYSKLTNACQPLDDVSNANMQVHKIALVTLVNESACALQDLATNAQNAGYSVLILPEPEMLSSANVPTQNKLIIPVSFVDGIYEFVGLQFSFKPLEKYTVEQYFSDADRTNVDILCPNCIKPGEDNKLRKMEPYLVRLYYWFLVGPLITLEWLRRTKKLCWMFGGQQVDEDQSRQTVENENVAESEIRTMEEGENGNDQLPNRRLLSNEDESIGTHQGPEGSREGEYGIQRGERQPLIIAEDDENARQLRGTGSVDYVKKIFQRGVMCFAYVILIITALPIGISSGGLSFFRFDQGTSDSRHSSLIAKSFLSDYRETHYQEIVTLGAYNSSNGTLSLLFSGKSVNIPYLFLISMWSPFQIFCFFLYSRFACNTTWAIPTNFSKLIRSDWFASNIYLLVLAVVVPYTSLFNFFYFATYNIVCTVCNILFIITVNKHKFVTRYVFYISVCMICAYIQSDIIAVFYFVLNSQGSLNNLKLTALRTLAIGLTLTVSFNSSMHIIRKLYKPQESLFEGLGEN